jgi:hypothetical protein
LLLYTFAPGAVHVQVVVLAVFSMLFFVFLVLLGAISRAEYIQLLLANIVYVYMLGHVYNVKRPFVGSVTERAIVLKAGFVVSGLLVWLFMV